jgi:hypothetical protein
MEIVKELDDSERNILRDLYRNHHLFTTHIEPILDQRHCFMVNIFAEDYGSILIYSMLADIAGNYPYQTLLSAIEYIKLNQAFLEAPSRGVLGGQRVKHYLVEFGACQGKLQDCFVEMRHCFMLDRSETSDKPRNEITDGMHRLVAYGLATDMNETYFPIPIYFGTDKT